MSKENNDKLQNNQYTFVKIFNKMYYRKESKEEKTELKKVNNTEKIEKIIKEINKEENEITAKIHEK